MDPDHLEYHFISERAELMLLSLQSKHERGELVRAYLRFWTEYLEKLRGAGKVSAHIDEISDFLAFVDAEVASIDLLGKQVDREVQKLESILEKDIYADLKINPADRTSTVRRKE